MAWKESGTSIRLAFSDMELTALDLVGEVSGDEYLGRVASQYDLKYRYKREAAWASLGFICWGLIAARGGALILALTHARRKEAIFSVPLIFR